MNVNLLSITELTVRAKTVGFPLRELFIREIAKRDNKHRPRYLPRLTVRDYALYDLP